MLKGISLTCFAASYAVVLLLELGRWYLRRDHRPWLVLATASAGFIAHSAYLALRIQDGLATRGVPLSNWYHWCLVAAWVVTLVYLLLLILKPQTSVGLFLLPLILALIGLAHRFPKDQMFATDHAIRVWGFAHGICLLVGAVGILVGFSAGLMYLIQAWQLKHKIGPLRGLRLPSLEWLQSLNERCLVWSTMALLLGVLAGVVLGLSSTANTPTETLATDTPTVWMSGVLVVWLLMATLFTIVYRPAREGRKMAYLTVTSFVVLILTMGVVLSSRHAGGHVPQVSGSDVVVQQEAFP